MKKSKSLLSWCLVIFVFSRLHVLAYAQKSIPERIISLGPSVTESFYLLGVEDKLVGVTSYCLRPPQAQEKEKIGTVVGINTEKIVSLRPDLVVATSLTDSRAIKKLRNLGIRVETLSQPQNFAQICEQFLNLSALVGKEKEADTIISIAKDKVNSIRKRVNSLQRPKVFIQVGAKPLVTVTSDSFVNDFIEFADGINIAKDAKVGLYSREEVLKKNPDVIIIVTMGIAGEEEKKIWQKYKTLKAANDNRIYIVDSYKLCSPTPLSFAESLEEIAQIIHPQKLGE